MTFSCPECLWGTNHKERANPTYMKNLHSSWVGCHWEQIFGMIMWNQINYLTYMKLSRVQTCHLTPRCRKYDNDNYPDCTRIKENISHSNGRGHREWAWVDYLDCTAIKLHWCDLWMTGSYRRVRLDWLEGRSFHWQEELNLSLEYIFWSKDSKLTAQEDVQLFCWYMRKSSWGTA